MVWVVSFIGALLPTFAISRLFLVLTNTWEGGTRRLLVIYVITIGACALIGGMGAADGGAFAPIQAAAQYAPACLTWFLFDWWREHRRS